MSRGAVTRVFVAVLVLASIADARVDGWMDREMKMKTTTKTVSSATIGAGGLAASASDAESCRRATWRVDAVEACGIVATRAETRCEFAVRATTCRLRRAGGRARVEACVGLGLDDDLDDGDGERGGASCERCAMRAFADARDAATRTRDETTFVLDGSMEFAIFIDETRAVESECAHVVALRRAEMAAASIESLSMRVAEADLDARRRAEAIAETLRDVDETARRNAAAAAEASRALDDVRRRQLEITTQLDGFFVRLEKFTANVVDAIARVERSSRFAAAAAGRCARLLADAFASIAAFETAIARACIVILGIARARFRRAAVVALSAEWIARAFVASPADRLRVGLACACAPTLRRVALAAVSSGRGLVQTPATMTTYETVDDAFDDADATAERNPSSRVVAAASRARATKHPPPLATRPRTRASARLRHRRDNRETS